MRIPGHRALTSLSCPSTTCANTKAPDHQDAHWRKCALSAPKARGVQLTTLLSQGAVERGYSSRTIRLNSASSTAKPPITTVGMRFQPSISRASWCVMAMRAV